MASFTSPRSTEEKSITVVAAKSYEEICSKIAHQIANLVRSKPNCVLGLATGSSPLGVYADLIRMHREEDLDFSDVTCFNLDEYYPMTPDDPLSYHGYMKENLFGRINCRSWHVPDAHPSINSEIARACAEYETRIEEAGGIDLQLLGVGRTGHIGFNEPGSEPNSVTRLVKLHPVTRADAASGFGDLSQVPVFALTMGIKTILSARKIVAMATGSAKAEIIRKALEGPVTEAVPASLLRTHSCASIYLDSAAAQLLHEQN